MFLLKRLPVWLACSACVALAGCGGGIVNDGGSTLEQIAAQNSNNSGAAPGAQAATRPKRTQARPSGGGAIAGPQGQQGMQTGGNEYGGGGGGAIAGPQGQQGMQSGGNEYGGGGFGGAIAGPQGQQPGMQTGGDSYGGGGGGAIAGPQGQQSGQQTGGDSYGSGGGGAIAGPQGQQGGAVSGEVDPASFAGQQGQGGRRMSAEDKEKEPERSPEEWAERVVGLFLDALDNEEYETFEQIISARAKGAILQRLRAGKSEESEEAVRRLQEQYARGGQSVVLHVTPMPDRLERRVAIGIPAASGGDSQGRTLAYVAVRQEGKAWRIISIQRSAG